MAGNRLTRRAHLVARIECEKVTMFESRTKYKLTVQRYAIPHSFTSGMPGEEQKLLGCLNDLYHSIGANVRKLLHDA